MDKIKKIKDWLKPYLEDRVRDEHEEGFFHCAMLLNDFLDTLSDEPDESLEGEAEKYADSIEGQEAFSYGADHYCWGDVNDAFIAGAKWMAEQGSTKNGEVTDDNDFIKFNDGTYIDLRPSLASKSFDFKTGDRVIVQIRNKEESK